MSFHINMNNSDSTSGEFFFLKLQKKTSLGIVWMRVMKRLVMLILLSIIIIAMLHQLWERTVFLSP